MSFDQNGVIYEVIFRGTTNCPIHDYAIRDIVRDINVIDFPLHAHWAQPEDRYSHARHINVPDERADDTMNASKRLHDKVHAL